MPQRSHRFAIEPMLSYTSGDGIRFETAFSRTPSIYERIMVYLTCSIVDALLLVNSEHPKPYMNK